MGNIEIVIKISEEEYNKKVPLFINGKPIEFVTILPKVHGRLIDADVLINQYNKYVGYTDIIYDLTKAKTIVESKED